MRCNLKGLLKYWIPPIVFAGIIFFLSSRSSVEIGPEIPHIDKLYHMIIYFIFAILLWRAFYYASSPSFQKRAIWLALLFTIIFGMSDEWHQLFVAFRHADVFDLLFDSLGASMAVIGVSWWNCGQKTEESDLDPERFSI
jgi:VanZ family protein